MKWVIIAAEGADFDIIGPYDTQADADSAASALMVRFPKLSWSVSVEQAWAAGDYTAWRGKWDRCSETS